MLYIQNALQRRDEERTIMVVEHSLTPRYEVHDEITDIDRVTEIPTFPEHVFMEPVTETKPSGRKRRGGGIIRKIRNVSLIVTLCMAVACVALAYGALKVSEASQGVGIEVASAPIYTRGDFNRERGR